MASNPRRNKDLAKIHLAQKQLGMDRDTYESMLWTVARVKSSADLDMHGRQKVLQHLRSLGFRDRRGKTPHYPGRPHNTDRDDQLKKIEALLADMKLPWKYVNGIMQQMNIPVKKIEFMNSKQKAAVIAALVKHQKSLKQQEH